MCHCRAVCPGGHGNVAYPEYRNLTDTGNLSSCFSLMFNYLCWEDTSHLMPLQAPVRQCNTEPQRNTSTPNTERRWCEASLVWTLWCFLEGSCAPRQHGHSGVPSRKVGCAPSWPWLWELLPAQLTPAGISCVILQWTPTSCLQRAEDQTVPLSRAAALALLRHVAPRMLKLLSLDILES